MPSVLLVGFGQAEREWMLGIAAQRSRFHTLVAASESDALEQFSREPFWAAVLLWSRGEPTGYQLELIRKLREPRIPCILLCDGEPTSETRALALEAGAVDYLGMNGRGARLRLLLDLFVSRSSAIEAHFSSLKDVVQGDDGLFHSPRMVPLLRQLARVAPLSGTIMLTGETGVGKTTLARWVHGNSDRHQRQFMSIACAAIPAALLESELFGHVRGAFTGADRDQPGKFQAVGQGTLLLDEVDCFPLELQAKLLRVVEQRTFEPVGSSKSQRLAARLIVATNRPLEQLVAAGQFRADLYYRLQVLSFVVPPLRQCQDSILALAEHFCRHSATQIGRRIDGFTSAAKQALLKHSWPGNIRELKNSIERAVALTDSSKIQWADLPESVRQGPVPEPAMQLALAIQPPDDQTASDNRLRAARSEAERRLLMESLERNGQNRTRTAADLGISRVTLYKRMERLGIFPLS
jgi:DNA-binding NtrC family response regulator